MVTCEKAAKGLGTFWCTGCFVKLGYFLRLAMIDRIGEDFDFYQKALGLRQQRQEILATNIANSDTPNFKARDVDFAASLREAMGDRLRLPDTQLSLTSARHIPAQALSTGPGDELYRVPGQPSLDGNTVDMNVERVQFADNTMRYQSDLSILSQRIKTLMMAMQN